MSNSAEQFAKIWAVKLAKLKPVLARLMRDVGNEALKWFLENFKKEQSPQGQPWQPRKVGGADDRGSRRALLVDSGRLRRSIRLTRVTRTSATIGTAVQYARYHNERTNRLPQRQFLGRSAVLERRLYRMIKAKILWAIK